MRLLTAVLNYNLNQESLALKTALSPFSETWIVDSGSKLSDAERAAFDLCLPNVFYSGMMNAVWERTADYSDDDVVFFITSDVTIHEPEKTISRLKEAFQNPDVWVYAPSENNSGHRQIHNAKTGGFRDVAFVEGFCFAFRFGLFRHISPINLEQNKYGWGVDLYLCYAALVRGKKVWVDDAVLIHHPRSTGYSADAARKAYRDYTREKGTGFSIFRKVVNFEPLKSASMNPWITRFPWKWLP